MTRRQIKFRIAYRSPHTDEPNKWLISEPITPAQMMWSEDTQVDFIGGGYLRFDEMNSPEDEAIFEQWTGLTDCNGVEIYEGDVVEHIIPNYCYGAGTKVLGFVKNGGWSFQIEQLTEKGLRECLGDKMTYAGPNPTESVVIGNIHQNPELIRSVPQS